MSTTWYVPVGPRIKNAELAIRKMTGWKKYDCRENTKAVQVLTDGEWFIHCDRRPIRILDHGLFATLERWNQNYPMEEVLGQISGSFNEHSDNTVINCDYCGRYMMSDEAESDGETVCCRIHVGKVV